ncbi:MAG: flavodoxin [Muribaculaceae bacterium]|nr:flavodoxin [Muribaculaceae bacterium]
MKRNILTTVLVTLCSLLGFNSCTAKTTGNDKTENKKIENMNNECKKLVVFFSHTGENYNVGYIEKGNTHIIADMIADATGADRFEIVPEKGYPKDSYDECIEIAKRELQQNARPAVKGDIAIEDYDVIFIGYPQWWGEPPMCVYTFINIHDWTGKTVIPFVTHEGSGMGGTDRKIASACKGADVAVGKGFAIEGNVAQKNQSSAQTSVNNWLEHLGFKK